MPNDPSNGSSHSVYGWIYLLLYYTITSNVGIQKIDELDEWKHNGNPLSLFSTTHAISSIDFALWLFTDSDVFGIGILSLHTSRKQFIIDVCVRRRVPTN